MKSEGSDSVLLCTTLMYDRYVEIARGFLTSLLEGR